MTYAERDTTLRSLGYFDYSEYLQSPLWNQIRSSVFKNCEKKCKLCKSKADVVHHRSYAEDVLTGERRDSSVLVALCDACHYAVEFRGKSKRSFQEAEVTFCRMSNARMPRNKRGRRSPQKAKVDSAAKLERKRDYLRSVAKKRGLSAVEAARLMKKALAKQEKRCLICKNTVKLEFWGKPNRTCTVCKKQAKRVRDSRVLVDVDDDCTEKHAKLDAELRAILAA